MIQAATPWWISASVGVDVDTAKREVRDPCCSCRDSSAQISIQASVPYFNRMFFRVDSVGTAGKQEVRAGLHGLPT